MKTHSSILAGRILWTEEPGRYSTQGGKESDATEVTEDRQTIEQLTLQNYPSQARWRELQYA